MSNCGGFSVRRFCVYLSPMETAHLPIAPSIGGALAFAAAYFLVGIPLKVIGGILYRLPIPQKVAFYILAPFYSPRSWLRSPALQSGHFIFAGRTALQWLLISLCTYALYWHIVSRYAPPPFVRAYMAFPAFYVLTETMGAVFRLIFLSSGRLICPVHNSPLLARSLAHFWGSCWNRWVGEWLRHIFFSPLMRHPRLGLLAAFVASGVWHELILTVPHYLMGHPVYFGPMAAYFLIQGLALLLEPRHWDRRLQRLYMHVVVIGPAPLVANAAFLHAFLL